MQSLNACRLLKWQQEVGVPGREVFEALCTAVEPLKTAERQPWKLQNASLRQGQVETPLGLKDAGIDLALHQSCYPSAGGLACIECHSPHLKLSLTAALLQQLNICHYRQHGW